MRLGSTTVPDEPLPSRILWVGIGCQRGTARAVIEAAVRAVFQAYDLAEDAIAGLATIDTKVNEAGLIIFCRERNLPLLFFKADVLRSVAVPNPSSVIKAAIGTPSVAEAAAILACWEVERGKKRATAETQRRGEMASPVLSTSDLCVPKQRFQSKDYPGSVMIAVARPIQTATHPARSKGKEADC